MRSLEIFPDVRGLGECRVWVVSAVENRKGDLGLPWSTISSRYLKPIAQWNEIRCPWISPRENPQSAQRERQLKAGIEDVLFHSGGSGWLNSKWAGGRCTLNTSSDWTSCAELSWLMVWMDYVLKKAKIFAISIQFIVEKKNKVQLLNKYNCNLSLKTELS